MLLQRLAEYSAVTSADAERAYSRERAVRWRLDLNSDGTLGDSQLVPLADATDKTRKNGIPMLLPHANRTAGVAPLLGADDLQYVLGWADEKSKPERVAKAHEAFVELHRAWAAAHPGEPAAAAISQFYAGNAVQAVRRPEKWTSKDTVVIDIDGRAATKSDQLWEFWAQVVEGRKSSTIDGEARRGVCLVCGATAALLNRLPQQIPKSLVPRADQDIALVSANKAIHTYDFSQGLGTAPICTGCGQRMVANLHAILADREHTFSYQNQSSKLIWWANGGETSLIRALDAETSKIKALLETVHEKAPPGPDGKAPDYFFSATISGNVSRLVVQDWVEMPLDDAIDNVRAWFDDQTIASRWEDGHQRYRLWNLILVLGRWKKSPGAERGAYARFDDKAADRPDGIAADLLRSALQCAPLPVTLLGHLVKRIRTDLRVDEPRMALLRLLLTRQFPQSLETLPMPTPGLNETDDTPAYLAGRIFAVLEDLQRSAYPGKEAPNTTFCDRYYAGAVVNPNVAIIQGNQLTEAWLKKLRGRGSLGIARIYKDRLTDLYSRFASSNGLPQRISTEEQGRFILGYHHQRAADLRRMRAGKAPEIPAPVEAPNDIDDSTIAESSSVA